jgi:hypothetical protein
VEPDALFSKCFCFPEESLDETYQGLYYKIAESIEKELTLAYYKLEDYRIVEKKDKMALGRMQALGGIFQTILLKRLESSVKAFKISVSNQIEFLSKFKEVLDQGEILKKKFYNKYLTGLEDESEAFDILEQIRRDLEDIDLSEYDKNRLYLDLESDIKTFGQILRSVEPIGEVQDAKLSELKKKLIQLKDQGKILLFSFYADTIDYLFDCLNNDREFLNAFNKKIEKIQGSFSTSRRQEVVERFLEQDTDLLLSTDILSE